LAQAQLIVCMKTVKTALTSPKNKSREHTSERMKKRAAMNSRGKRRVEQRKSDNTHTTKKGEKSVVRAVLRMGKIARRRGLNAWVKNCDQSVGERFSAKGSAKYHI